jgi:hypothetical protein
VKQIILPSPNPFFHIDLFYLFYVAFVASTMRIMIEVGFKR